MKFLIGVSVGYVIGSTSYWAYRLYDRRVRWAAFCADYHADIKDVN